MWEFLLDTMPRIARWALIAGFLGGILGGVLAARLERNDLAPQAAVAGFLAAGLITATLIVLWKRRRRSR